MNGKDLLSYKDLESLTFMENWESGLEEFRGLINLYSWLVTSDYIDLQDL